MTLHDDTQAFLATRNAFRNALARALRSEVTEGAIAVEVHRVSDGTPEPACEILPREERDSCATYAGLDIVPAIECQSDENGWPGTDGLYQTMLDALTKDDSPDRTAEAQIRLMRQINLMESYRKMLLHKKQRTPQFMAAWCQVLKSEKQSQDEIEKLLLNQAIGRNLVEEA